MGFSLANAMSGAGGAVAEVGSEWGKSIIREGAESRLMEQRGKQESALMQERAKIEEMRIERERARVAGIGKEAEAARTAPAYDPATDSTRPQTPAEAANAAASIYNRNGLIELGMRTREFEDNRAARAEDRLDRRIDKTADNERADRQLQNQIDHQKRMEGMAGAAAKLSRERFEFEKKQVELGKAPTTLADGSIGFVGIKEVDGKPMRQFTPLVDEAGKPVKGPKNMSESNKVFYAAQAKIAAESMNEDAVKEARKVMAAIQADPAADFTKPQGASVPSDAHIVALQNSAGDPRAVAAFDSTYGNGAAKRYLGDTKQDKQKPSTAAPVAPGAKQQSGPVIPDDMKQDFEVASSLAQSIAKTRQEMAGAKGDSAKLLELNKQYSQQQSVLDQYKQRFLDRGIRL